MINLTLENNLICISFDYNPTLVEAVKSVPSAKWSKLTRQWTVSPHSWKYIYDLFNHRMDVSSSTEVKNLLSQKNRNLSYINKLKEQKDYPFLSYSKSSNLYPFQRVGVRFLSLPGNKFLADEMGLGKSCQTIATAEEIGAKKILVICPNSLKLVWSEEIKKWSDLPATVLPSKASKKKKEQILEDYETGFFILNYEAVRGSYLDYLIARTWEMLILDESTKVKNIKAQVTKDCAKLVADKKILLSGAPITRNAADLFSQLAMIAPDKYLSFWKFADKFCDIQENRFGKQATGCKSFDALKYDISEFTIRRTKKLVKADLPDKIKQTIKLENMVSEQARIYEIIRDQILEEIEAEKEEKLRAPIVLTKFLRLSQATSSTANLGYPDYSAKLDYLEEIIEERHDDHKICVWCNFKPTISCIESRLKDYKLLILTGDTEDYVRQENIHRFNTDPSCRIFISTYAAKYGFSIVPISNGSPENLLVIYVSKTFNADDILQSEERTHRITTMVPVEYLSLVQKDTIDQYIEYNLSQKGKILAGVFGVDKHRTLNKKEVINIIKNP